MNRDQALQVYDIIKKEVNKGNVKKIATGVSKSTGGDTKTVEAGIGALSKLVAQLPRDEFATAFSTKEFPAVRLSAKEMESLRGGSLGWFRDLVRYLSGGSIELNLE